MNPLRSLRFRHRRSSRTHTHAALPWSVGSLERRVMLAGDGASAITPLAPTSVGHTADSDLGAQSSSAFIGQQAMALDAQTQTVQLVFVDPNVDDVATVVGNINGHYEIMLLDGDRAGLDQISDVLRQRTNVSGIHLISHGSTGRLMLGNQRVSIETLDAMRVELNQWSNSLTVDADILLYGCETGAGQTGRMFVEQLAKLTGADVAASTNRTGHASLNADWVLEQIAGTIESSIVVDAQFQHQYVGSLPITLRAAGVTNDEQMQLHVDGIAVATFSNVGGDATAGVFQDYTYNVDGISADRIRVVFTNDLYDPANGIDRDLRVDRITVDGQVFETEDPSVFSTGTWLPADGLSPGFRESEYLTNTGYFQYSSGETTQIGVRARGTDGAETMQLQIDGVVVQQWENVGTTLQTFNYQANGNITAAQIRVAFTNDSYDPANGIDLNLVVDSIAVDGVTFETEDPAVFSTGTWKPADGVVAGFRESELLHANGYFQYSDPTGGNGTIITVFARGETGQESMELRIDDAVVRSWQNVATGLSSYVYQASSNITADRIRVGFTNDLYDIANGIDRNLVVDRIELDASIYQTEAPTVFSTGTWKPADGVVPGFRESEVLHTNGYFQYGVPPSNFGVIGLETSVVNVGESGNATLTILRTQGSDGVITVDYRTVDGTATAGSDYSSRTGTLTFQQGETSKFVTVPILPDSLVEGNETFAFTIDNVQGGATLLVPRTATVTITDDDLPSYSNFASTAGLTLNGGAAGVANALRLTPAQNTRAGSAYFTSPVPITADTSFQSNFQFRIGGGQGTGGADGMAFVVQNSPQATAAIGSSGGGVGYVGITNSLAIELDTYQNPYDVNGNHVSILINGNATGSLDTRSPAFDLNSDLPINTWVDYNGITNQLAVYLSQTTTKPNQPLVSADVDLSNLVGSQAYLGFTAGTGGLNNYHDVLNWQFNTEVPPPIDPPDPGTDLTNELVASGFVKPTAIAWTPDGSNLYVSEQRGIIRVVRNGTLQSAPLLDFQDRVNGTRDRGLLDIAVHPDLVNSPYLYLLYTYDPPEVFNNVGNTLARPDGNGNRAGRLTRVTLDAATNYTSIVPNSEVVILGTNSVWSNFNAFANSTSNFNEPPAGILPNGTNIQDFIATDSESHTIGTVTFGPDGALYVSIGDGTSYNQVDPRTTRVQDIDNLSGKILRIDPLTGDGLSDNPFYNGDPDANRSKVYQLGVRNPFRTTVHPTTGQVYIGDVGWGTWEEINAGAPGDNFGWPYFEGGSGTNNRTSGYQNLPSAAAFYNTANVTPSILALNHAADGINAIVLGEIYTGDTYPTQYAGDLFFNDLGQGIVRNVSFNAAGGITSVETFTTGANIVVMIAQGPDGNLYYVDLDDGEVGRWLFV